MRRHPRTTPNPAPAPRTGRLLLTVVLLLALGGCGRQGTIQGQVTVDGQPLEQGYINFRPLPEAQGPTLGIAIEKGSFSLVAKDQLPQGPYRVEITSQGRISQQARDSRGREIEVDGQILPARYNRQSELQVEFANRTSNRFDFTLTSR